MINEVLKQRHAGVIQNHGGALCGDTFLMDYISHEGGPAHIHSFFNIEPKYFKECVAELEKNEFHEVFYCDAFFKDEHKNGIGKIYVSRNHNTAVLLRKYHGYEADNTTIRCTMVSTNLEHYLVNFFRSFKRTPSAPDLKFYRLVWDSVDSCYELAAIKNSTISSKHKRENDAIIYPGINLGKIRTFFDKNFDLDKGRILMLSGPPGTGKTSLLKDVISHAKAENMTIVITDPQTFMKGGADKLINLMSYYPNIIFVVEDAEAIVTSRETSKDPSFMSAILNVTDGLFSMAISARFCFSYNTAHTNIDAALTRKGRCYHVQEFRSYNSEEAVEVCKALGIEKDVSYPVTYTLADLTN